MSLEGSVLTTDIFGWVINSWTNGVMLLLAFGVFYLAVSKGFEPLLLLPISAGIMFANLSPGMVEDGGILSLLKRVGLETQLFPLLMFLGLGAMTDLAILVHRPVVAWLGAAAQIGIFSALVGAVLMGFDQSAAASIAIIGGADGPTAVYVSTRLTTEEIWGPVALCAYSYMAMVPIIQPPIMRLLTTKKERSVRMELPLEPIPRSVRLCLPIIVLALTALLAPKAIPIVGMMMFGNLLKESEVVERLVASVQNEVVNVVTIFLGLTVGSTMTAERFLKIETMEIFGLGLFAFTVATIAGIAMGKLMYLVSRGTINPLLGAAGVSAVPMSARAVHRVALEADPGNYLVMHAIGPNVAGVLGSAIAAGVLMGIIS